MKRIICLILLLMVSFTGCGSTKTEFLFKDLGFKTEIDFGESVTVSHENKTLLVCDLDSGDSIGVISADKIEGKSINEIFDFYVGSGEGIKKTNISDNLIYFDYQNEIDSVYIDNRVEKMYCFIFYEENTGAVLYGRFFENSERDYVISLAKSIEVARK